MIASNFIYCQPYTLDEAIDAYSRFYAAGKNTLYYAGGSEIITMSRSGSIRPEVIIDVKNIAILSLIAQDDENLSIGSACTLNQISQSGLFPLLGLTCGRIADHTNQCRITLGGNLCGTIIYRETSLPLLLSDAKITLFGPEGERKVAFAEVFRERMQLKPGEMIVQLHIPSWALSAKYAHIKKTTNEKIDYPLLSLGAIWKDNVLRTAFSGIAAYPLRSQEVENILNLRGESCRERAEKAAYTLSDLICSDVRASSEYRLFVLGNTLEMLLEDWENAAV